MNNILQLHVLLSTRILFFYSSVKLRVSYSWYFITNEKIFNEWRASRKEETDIFLLRNGVIKQFVERYIY